MGVGPGRWGWKTETLKSVVLRGLLALATKGRPGGCLGNTHTLVHPTAAPKPTGGVGEGREGRGGARGAVFQSLRAHSTEPWGAPPAPSPRQPRAGRRAPRFPARRLHGAERLRVLPGGPGRRGAEPCVAPLQKGATSSPTRVEGRTSRTGRHGVSDGATRDRASLEGEDREDKSPCPRLAGAAESGSRSSQCPHPDWRGLQGWGCDPASSIWSQRWKWPSAPGCAEIPGR